MNLHTTSIYDFLKEAKANKFTQGRHFEVYDECNIYIRPMYTPDGLNNICIANIDFSEKNRNKGYFRQLVHYLIMHAPELGYTEVSVENVMNPILDSCLVRYGFTPKKNELDICYTYSFKVKTVEEFSIIDGFVLRLIDPAPNDKYFATEELVKDYAAKSPRPCFYKPTRLIYISGEWCPLGNAVKVRGAPI